jgi:DNA polymerase
VICDYSSIEARVVQWLAGDETALNVFRADKDVYKDMATTIFETSYDRVEKKERFVGKIAVLGLGYAMGVDKFLSTCHDWGAIFVDEDLAERTVHAFRTKYRALRNFWYLIEDRAIDAINNPGYQFEAGRHLAWICHDGFLKMILPSGRCIYYYGPEIRRETVTWKGGSFETDTIYYTGIDTYTRKWGETKTYGGKLVENATQAVARDILAYAMMMLESQGHPVVMHVHDEAVVESPIGKLTPTKMEEIMCDLPSWAEGLPVKAEAFASKRFRK